MLFVYYRTGSFISACLLIALHDFLDHLDGIVAKMQRRKYGPRSSDPLLGGFLDAFCDKVCELRLWTDIICSTHRRLCVPGAYECRFAVLISSWYTQSQVEPIACLGCTYSCTFWSCYSDSIVYTFNWMKFSAPISLLNYRQKIFSQKLKRISWWPVTFGIIQPLKKAKKQGECH